MRAILNDDAFARRVALVQAALDLPTSTEVPTSPSACRAIIEHVAAKHGTTVFEITSDRRPFWLRDIRQEAMYRCVRETQHSLPTIAKVFRRDHTSIINGVQSYAKRHGLQYPGRRVT